MTSEMRGELRLIFVVGQMLRLVNISLCGVFSQRYNELSRKYRFVMHLIELYAPYSLFKGWYATLVQRLIRIIIFFCIVFTSLFF